MCQGGGGPLWQVLLPRQGVGYFYQRCAFACVLPVSFISDIIIIIL